MQDILDKMKDWALRNKMGLNSKKTKDMWICFKEDISERPLLEIGDNTIERVRSFKLLVLCCSNSLKWNKHVEEITKRANKCLWRLR